MKRNDLEYYELNAESWWKEGEALNLSDHFNQTRFDFFKNYIPNWKGIKALDIGCGGGLACEVLAKLGAKVSGIDLSLNSIETAREHARNNGLKIDYQCGAAEDLPYYDNTFDVVLCFDVLEHVGDLKKVLSEAYRVLNKNGFFLFDTINRTFKSKVIMIWLLEDLLRQLPQGLHDWTKFIKPNELSELMEGIGFSEIVIKGFDITDGTNFETLKNIVAKGLSNQRPREKPEFFKIQINEDTSVCYIGKTVKR